MSIQVGDKAPAIESSEFSLADAKGKPRDFHANFEDGWECQRVLEAVTVSAREKRWVNVKEVV